MRNILILLRVGTLGSRFLFVLYLANKLSVTELGTFGAYSATIFLVSYFVGLESGTISSRNIYVNDEYKTSLVISKMTVLIILSALIIIPIIFSIQKIIINNNLGLVFIMIIMEALCTEYRKILNSLNRPLLSGIIDFVKTAIWTWPLIWFFTFYEKQLSIEMILISWSVGLLLSIVIIIIKLNKYFIFSLDIFNQIMNLSWQNGQIFFNSFTLLFIEASARLMMQLKGDSIELGVFTLYSGFVFSLPVLVWSATLLVDYRNILNAVQKKDDNEFNIQIKNNFLLGFFYCLIFTMLSILTMLIYLKFLGKKDYQDYVGAYFVMLTIPFVHLFMTNLSNVLHMRKRDDLIAIASFSALIFCVPYYYIKTKILIWDVIFCMFTSYSICAGVMFFYVRKNFGINFLRFFIFK